MADQAEGGPDGRWAKVLAGAVVVTAVVGVGLMWSHDARWGENARARREYGVVRRLLVEAQRACAEIGPRCNDPWDGEFTRGRAAFAAAGSRRERIRAGLAAFEAYCRLNPGAAAPHPPRMTCDAMPQSADWWERYEDGETRAEADSLPRSE